MKLHPFKLVIAVGLLALATLTLIEDNRIVIHSTDGLSKITVNKSNKTVKFQAEIDEKYIDFTDYYETVEERDQIINFYIDYYTDKTGYDER